MSVDLLIRGGTVVDGTAAPGFTADVAVRDGRIAEVGRLAGDVEATEVIDADGLTVTPGFIDIHTHYDAQLHWDPTASPASWHGVTTIFTGNCGFTVSPAAPDDVDWLLLMLSRVEGMSPDALQLAVDWSGGSFEEFLDNLDGRVGVNVAANVGHCALRRMVMGDAASERAATTGEIAQMQQALRDAFAAGAAGFTSSQLEIHVAHDGRGVPSNHATADELLALAAVVGETRTGAIEFIPRSFLTGYDDDDRRLIRAMASVASVPVHLNTLAPLHPSAPDGWERSVEFARAAADDGFDIHPMFAANRQGAHFALGNTFLFDEMPSFRESLTAPDADRRRMLADPALRDRMRADIAKGGTSFVFFWPVIRCESVARDANTRYVGMSVTEIAAAMGEGRDELDAFLDLSLADDLATQFGLVAPPDPRRRAATEALIREPLVMAGSSDGGAHLLSFCGADFTTRLLTEWTDDVLTFEQAVARLTSIPAHTQGLEDRGTLRPGAAADIVLIDREHLATPDSPRYVQDLPAGSGRYVCDATGYDSVIVNGRVLLRQGSWTGATPGKILRGTPRG
jgi:N-acyl-D-aspartate/D-glutamate deacylase